MQKIVALIAVLMLTLSTLLFFPICTAYPTPSVPEFSIKFVDASYDVPTTYTIDPYTGQEVTNQGYHVSKVNLVMFIENQPLVYDPQYKGGFLYNIQVKGHYEQNWTQLFLNDNIPTANYNLSQTLVIIGTLGADGLTLTGRSTVIPIGGVEDFRIMGMIGGFFKVSTGEYVGLGHTEFSGTTSDWSSTQTLTIDKDAPTITVASPAPTAIVSPTITSSPNPTVTLNPTTTPSQSVSDGSDNFDLNSLEIVILLVAVIILLVLVVVFYLRRRKAVNL